MKWQTVFVAVACLLALAHGHPNLSPPEEDDLESVPDIEGSNREGKQNPISNFLNNLPGPLSPQSPHNPINFIGNLLGRTTTGAPGVPGATEGPTTTRQSILGGILNFGNVFNPNRPPTTVPTTTSIITGVDITIPQVAQAAGVSSAVTPALPIMPSTMKSAPQPPIAAPTFINRIVQIFSQVQGGFTNTLGRLMYLPPTEIPQDVRDSADTVIKLAETNSLNFQPVMDQLPFLAMMSPQRQFESILRIIRPTDGTLEQTFFKASNTILDFLSNPRFTTHMRNQFIESFPNIHNSLQDMWINVSQFMASYSFNPLFTNEGNPTDLEQSQ